MDAASAHPAHDELARTVSADGSVTVRAVVGTELVREARQRHALSPTATNALGRALMGGILISAAAQEGETVQIQLRGDGRLGNILVIAESDGHVRGTVGNPSADLPSRDGVADVAGLLGAGTLVVVRSHPRWREPYTGITPLANGEVATDLARYLTESEQTPSAVGLGVAIEGGSPNPVAAAGGFLVQALPDADDDILAIVERNVQSIWSPAEMVRSGARGRDIVEILLQGVGWREITSSRPLYRCPCRRERVTRAVMLLGREELHEIARAGETLEVRCEFCGERYEIEADEVGSMALDS